MILLALNELNLDYIKGYVSQGKLTNFGRLLEYGVVNTTSESECLLRLPLFFNITDAEANLVIAKIREFFS